MAALLSLLRHTSPLRIRLYCHAHCRFQFIFHFADHFLKQSINRDALRWRQAIHNVDPVRFSLLLCRVPFFLRSRHASAQPYVLLSLHRYHLVCDIYCYAALNINSQCRRNYSDCEDGTVPLHLTILYVTQNLEYSHSSIVFWGRLDVVAASQMPGHQWNELGRHFSELHIFCQRNTTVRPICTLAGHFNFLLLTLFRHRFRLWAQELFFRVKGHCRSWHLSGPILLLAIRLAVGSLGIWHSNLFEERWERKRRAP